MLLLLLFVVLVDKDLFCNAYLQIALHLELPVDTFKIT